MVSLFFESFVMCLASRGADKQGLGFSLGFIGFRVYRVYRV